MRRIAALSTFLLLAGGSKPALADLIWDEPPQQPQQPGSKNPSQQPGSKKSCAVNYQSDAILGAAALALLVSGMALRRRGRSAEGAAA
jgi:hypothetical protein